MTSKRACRMKPAVRLTKLPDSNQKAEAKSTGIDAEDTSSNLMWAAIVGIDVCSRLLSLEYQSERRVKQRSRLRPACPPSGDSCTDLVRFLFSYKCADPALFHHFLAFYFWNKICFPVRLVPSCLAGQRPRERGTARCRYSTRLNAKERFLRSVAENSSTSSSWLPCLVRAVRSDGPARKWRALLGSLQKLCLGYPLTKLDKGRIPTPAPY